MMWTGRRTLIILVFDSPSHAWQTLSSEINLIIINVIFWSSMHLCLWLATCLNARVFFIFIFFLRVAHFLYLFQSAWPRLMWSRKCLIVGCIFVRSLEIVWKEPEKRNKGKERSYKHIWRSNKNAHFQWALRRWFADKEMTNTAMTLHARTQQKKCRMSQWERSQGMSNPLRSVLWLVKSEQCNVFFGLSAKKFSLERTSTSTKRKSVLTKGNPSDFAFTWIWWATAVRSDRNLLAYFRFVVCFRIIEAWPKWMQLICATSLHGQSTNNNNTWFYS